MHSGHFALTPVSKIPTIFWFGVTFCNHTYIKSLLHIWDHMQNDFFYTRTDFKIPHHLLEWSEPLH